MINDASNDTLASASAHHQNSEKHIIARPEAKLRQKRAKVDDTGKRVYNILRKARVDKYYKGQREARAKADAEKEEGGASKKPAANDDD